MQLDYSDVALEKVNQYNRMMVKSQFDFCN